MPRHNLPDITNQMGGTGLERVSETSGNRGDAGQSGAESGRLGARDTPINPELTAVVEAWPGLPEAIKGGILAMVRAAQ